MRPVVCVKCRLFFKPKKNSIYIEEGRPVGETAGVTSWAPYKLWQADLWACKGCGAEIVVGFGRAPVVEHYHRDYQALVDATRPLFRVDDC